MKLSQSKIVINVECCTLASVKNIRICCTLAVNIQMYGLSYIATYVVTHSYHHSYTYLVPLHFIPASFLKYQYFFIALMC